MKTQNTTFAKWVTLVCFTLASMSGLKSQNPVKDSTNTTKEEIRQINLNEIRISASFMPEKSTPLRLTSVNHSEISAKATGQTFPELLKRVPGIYATAESGSYGDAKINIRGFKQENISVMLNGIPISGLTTGGMYWNNWAGLADATSMIQVQKGPGASMLSDNSMGGTINIITTLPVERASASAGVSATDYGLFKYQASLNSGVLKNGWALSLSTSYVTGNTFIESSDVNSWAYLLTVSKKIGERHSLVMTLLGSPERHQQRSAKLTAAEVEEYGTSYNKNWGWDDGKRRNISENFYHKPYLTIHHFYKITPATTMNSAVYLSTGDGGGKWSESKGKSIIEFQKDGQIDWNEVISTNRDPQTGESIRVQTDYLAGHLQTGLKWGINTKLSPNLSLESGLHYQFYSTWEKEVITDLLGGDYWYEDYENNSMAGVAGRDQIKVVGDEIRLNSGKIINHGTLYTMISYETPRLTSKVGVSIFGTTIRRRDNYNYVGNEYSRIAYGRGFSLKAGILGKISRTSSVYINAAINSRIPYSDVFFSSWNNNITNGVKNERNLLTEAGFRTTGNKLALELTAYAALWKNKSVMSNPYVMQETGLNRFLVRGLDALHTGLEADISYAFTSKLRAKSYLSIADWRWKNDVSATIFDNYSWHIIGTLNIYTNGLPVGDSPQNQLSLGVEYTPVKYLTLNGDLNYYGKFYADFEPSSRSNPNNPGVYRIPSYTVVNASANYRFSILGKRSSAILNLNNLTDKIYIERGTDGSDHTINTFKGFWSNGFSANLALRIDL